MVRGLAQAIVIRWTLWALTFDPLALNVPLCLVCHTAPRNPQFGLYLVVWWAFEMEVNFGERPGAGYYH